MVEDDDAVAGLEFRDVGAHVRDHARGLMAVNARRGEQVVFDLLEIGVADAAGFHADEDFARADLGRVDLSTETTELPR